MVRTNSGVLLGFKCVFTRNTNDIFIDKAIDDLGRPKAKLVAIMLENIMNTTHCTPTAKLLRAFVFPLPNYLDPFVEKLHINNQFAEVTPKQHEIVRLHITKPDQLRGQFTFLI